MPIRPRPLALLEVERAGGDGHAWQKNWPAFAVTFCVFCGSIWVPSPMTFHRPAMNL